MKKSVLTLAAACVLMAVVPLGAAPLGARLMGFERADMLTAQVVVRPEGPEVIVSEIKSAYGQTLAVYIAAAFDLKKSVLVGEIPSGWDGDITFKPGSLDLAGKDTVLVMVPGWSVPVAVGLLREVP